MASPYENLEQFRNHPFIQSIKDLKKWTITFLDQEKKRKIPADMHELMHLDRIRGGDPHTPYSLTDLDTMDNFFKSHGSIPTNHAFYLDAILDGFVVLDVEPDCREVVKQAMLDLPFLYAERSMSGKGMHLVFPVPKCFADYPAAMQKPAIKSKEDSYEILLNHFVTFTGDIIKPPAEQNGDFEAIYKSVAENVKEQMRIKDLDISDFDVRPGTDYDDNILSLLIHAGKQWRKRPEDFPKSGHNPEPDMSNYEWHYLSYLEYKLRQILEVQKFHREEGYSDDDKIYYLYNAATAVIPHRDKHDTCRTTNSGITAPWLAFLAIDVMEKAAGRLEEEAEQKAAKKKAKKNT